MKDSIRENYEKDGVEGYYRREGHHYRNPHEDALRATLQRCLSWDLDLSRVLDLGAGSGEVTLFLQENGVLPQQIDACDPYTGAAFLERVGRPCASWSFRDLVGATLQGRHYSLIVASYSLHLCPESMLPSLMMALGRHSSTLLCLSPHKRPELRWGWRLDREGYDPIDRVRARLYRLG